MRVVFLTHNYPRHAGDPAGAFLSTLARALVDAGIDVRVVAPSDRGEAGDAALDGIPVRRVRYAAASRETIAYGAMTGALKRPGGWTALAGLWRALGSAAREELADGADLIHAHWWVPAGLATPKEARFVLTSHGSDAALLRQSRVAQRLARPVYSRARVVTTVSRELAGWIQTGAARYVGAEHIQPMPVDSTAFPWSEGGDGAVVVGRLTRQKRVDLALRALAVVISCGHEIGLTVVGDGPERPELERIVGELGIGDFVRFIGAVAPEEVPGFLARADLSLFTAQGEGFGLAAAEALMSGVPVVACWDGGGLLDVVPPSGAGRLALPAPDAVADAMLDVLGDPDRREMARVTGESWRARLAPEQVAARCIAWYEEALRG